MLTERQLDALTEVFREGAQDASLACSRWVGRSAQILVQRVEQLEMAEAVAVLGASEEPISACIMAIEGRLTGGLMLAFDDASGWALTDLLLELPPGSCSTWGEMERSAVLETTNIVGCAYLNSLSRLLRRLGEPPELMPSPPQFTRDYASAILQSVFLNQVMSSDTIFLAETQFHLDGTPTNWNLLFVPDADSISTLRRVLA